MFIKIIENKWDRVYEEEINIDTIVSYFNELKNKNVLNNDVSLETFYSPLNICFTNVDDYENKHFVYEYIERLFKEHKCPRWLMLMDSDRIKLEFI